LGYLLFLKISAVDTFDFDVCSRESIHSKTANVRLQPSEGLRGSESEGMKKAGRKLENRKKSNFHQIIESLLGNFMEALEGYETVLNNFLVEFWEFRWI
jgi:hypothetical protein